MSNRSKRTIVVANAEPAFVQSCMTKWSKGLQRGAKWDKVRRKEPIYVSPAAARKHQTTAAFVLLRYLVCLPLTLVCVLTRLIGRVRCGSSRPGKFLNFG